MNPYKLVALLLFGTVWSSAPALAGTVYDFNVKVGVPTHNQLSSGDVVRIRFLRAGYLKGRSDNKVVTVCTPSGDHEYWRVEVIGTYRYRFKNLKWNRFLGKNGGRLELVNGSNNSSRWQIHEMSLAGDTYDQYAGALGNLDSLKFYYYSTYKGTCERTGDIKGYSSIKDMSAVLFDVVDPASP